jgi:hypothetical protein
MTQSEQSRADALADAETLRWFTWAIIAAANRGTRKEFRIRGLINPRRLPTLPSIVKDVQQADASSLVNLAPVWNLTERQVIPQIVEHARAAFRAVPGLRG